MIDVLVVRSVAPVMMEKRNVTTSKGNRDRRMATKASKVGPGGISCSCCRKGTKAEVKKWHNKAVRRKVRTTLREQI